VNEQGSKFPVGEKINALFTLERASAQAQETPDQLHERCQREAKPKLEKLKLWLDEELRDLLPKTPTAGAIGYCLRHWDALTRYLDDGRTKIDNNAAERALRVVAVGNKNWMFAGSEKGGHAAACMYKMIESAKACGLNPREYLEDVLPRIPSTLKLDINMLLPQNWRPLTP